MRRILYALALALTLANLGMTIRGELRLQEIRGIRVSAEHARDYAEYVLRICESTSNRQSVRREF